ncbi:MAG TPA: hypothetical protein VII45_11075 [Solirubrobacterales bacterium]
MGAAAIAAVAVLVSVAVALAAPPLPTPERAFQTPAGVHRTLTLTLVSGATGKTIEEGAAALGSEFALSGGVIHCPKAKRAAGFHGAPFAAFGFPRTPLKLSHGSYGFSTHVTQRRESLVGSTAPSFTLKLKITGAVVNPTTIEGTIRAKGGKCTIGKPLSYTAKLNPQDQVAPNA